MLQITNSINNIKIYHLFNIYCFFFAKLTRKSRLYKMVKFIYTIFCCFAVLCFAVSTRVNECSQGGLTPEVHVPDCDSDSDLLCIVKFMGDIDLTMKFKTPHYLETLKPQIIGKSLFGNFTISPALPFTIEFSIMDEDKPAICFNLDVFAAKL
ncbi:hypothetical protein NQ317_018657 [Molorchus minor]|uniref:MD-2-related lipid-recognition domain-containing protein n=1 Tax=Molorchus minor TaxID=1323400 RepID=A0ABQ9IVL9_9CUCU|nr:hypothetical protein NQ317_018657 [Molorchus minor]